MSELEQDIKAYEQALCVKYNKAIHLRYHINRMALSDLLDHVKNVTQFNPERKTRRMDLIIIRHLYFKMASELGYTHHQIGNSINMDHSSVTYGIRTINQRIVNKEQAVINMYNEIKSKLL